MTTGSLKTRGSAPATPRRSSGTKYYGDSQTEEQSGTRVGGSRAVRTGAVRTGSARPGSRVVSARVAGGTARPVSPVENPASPRTLRRTRRLGSQQQVSVRGRRIAPVKSQSALKNWAVAAVAAFLLGIGFTQYLSGVTTEQSFQIAESKEQSTALSDQLESLERDVAVAQSGGNIAAEAAKLGMVAPQQPGILSVEGDKVEERREMAGDSNRPVVDVNGNQRQPGATSDPNKTNNVPGLAPQSAAGAAAQNNSTGAVPYSDQQSGNAGNTSSPAPNAGNTPAAPAAPAAPAPAANPAAAPVAPPN